MTKKLTGSRPPRETPREADTTKKGWPLFLLVVLGLLGSLLVLVLLGWYFTEQEYRRQCAQVCPAWSFLPPLDSEEMFAVIRNTVTAGAALGLGVTIVLSYRRQRVAEQTLIYTAETQRLAVEAQSLESQRLERDSMDTLRKRYLDIATLLNSAGDLNKITALHALESLTVSWRQFGNDREASAAVGLLLSTARLTSTDVSPQAQEFRQAVIRTLDRHLQIEVSKSQGWGSLTIDATRCIGSTGVNDWVIDGGNLTATPRQPGYVIAEGLRIERGAVFLRSSDKIPSSAVGTNTLRRLVISSGELRVRAVKGPSPTTVEITDGILSGGIIVFSGLLSESLPRTYQFDDCIFSGTTIRATANKVAHYEFNRCRFTAAPSTVSWIKQKTRSASFTDCVAVSPSGKELPVTSLEELYSALNFQVAQNNEAPDYAN